ncbi:transporter substrate-binding domain-containing protein [Paractinoplanes rhizophilus]|uniref:Transporter substrate-binding domain-containing protein n=1 Tax=Paractinoplanes rhizophilus TaxID=1416877 RepID=A0ABW2HYY6_9ACTN|nr:transporter substrate-binding domain-containing protein [Actinoplanes sp.]
MTEGNPGRFAWPVRRRTPPGPEGTAEDIAVQDIAEREAADRQLPPPAPEPLVEPRPRVNLAAFRLAALGLALVLALALAIMKVFGGGPPSVAELRAEAGVDDWPVLTVGIKDDQPGVGLYDKGTQTWSGFDVDIAYMIAEDLGFRRSEVRFYGIQSEDRARMQASDAGGNRVPVKMVIASYSITQEREQMAGVTFSAPYLYTEQSVLTLRGHPRVTTLGDLRGKQVCSLSTSTSLTAPENAGAILRSKNLISECIADLRAHQVEAVTTDAAILAGYKTRHPGDFDHWDLGLDQTEAWGVNVGENPALKKLVDLTLYRSLKDPKDDRWERAYQHDLQVEVKQNGTTPIAIATQPDVPRPDIRDLPWEGTFG